MCPLRYLGDENTEKQASKADAILKKLKADAEARRKLRGIGTRQSPQDNSKKKLSSEKVQVKNDRTPKSGEKIKIGRKSKLKECDETAHADNDNEVIPKKRRKGKLDKEEKNSRENENSSQATYQDSESSKHGSNADTTTKELKFRGKAKSVSADDEGEQEIDEFELCDNDQKADDTELLDDTQEGAHEYGGFTVLGDYRSKQTEKVCVQQSRHLSLKQVLASSSELTSDHSKNENCIKDIFL